MDHRPSWETPPEAPEPPPLRRWWEGAVDPDDDRQMWCCLLLLPGDGCCFWPALQSFAAIYTVGLATGML